MLNFVYGKDSWAYIRDGGDGCEVPLTQWAKIECLRHGCDEFSAQSPQDIDMEVGGCIMDFPSCPVALAYTFACQAAHVRSRLKMYEDILFNADGEELITLDQLKDLTVPPPNEPLTLDELQKMSWEPAWVDGARETKVGHSGWAIIWYCEFEKYVCVWWPGEEYADIPSLDSYGDTWIAYRRKPEKGKQNGP